MGDALVTQLRAAGCVYAEEEAVLLRGAVSDPGELDALATRRVAGEPLEQLLGWAEFGGMRVAVTPGVFVPRPRSEVLVAQTLAVMPAEPATVVDLCCGSGAIGLVIATRRPDVELHAADVDAVAVACARQNLAPVGGVVHLGDLTDALPAALRGRIDVLVANLPYVPSDAIATMPAEARDHEPRAALDGGSDGLDVLRRLAPQAAEWLAPGGWLLVETSRQQAPVAADLVRTAGLAPAVVQKLDVAVVCGRDRVAG